MGQGVLLEGQFQSSLELSPECNSFILVCVLDGVQEGVIGQHI